MADHIPSHDPHLARAEIGAALFRRTLAQFLAGEQSNPPKLPFPPGALHRTRLHKLLDTYGVVFLLENDGEPALRDQIHRVLYEDGFVKPWKCPGGATALGDRLLLRLSAGSPLTAEQLKRLFRIAARLIWHEIDRACREDLTKEEPPDASLSSFASLMQTGSPKTLAFLSRHELIAVADALAAFETERPEESSSRCRLVDAFLMSQLLGCSTDHLAQYNGTTAHAMSESLDIIWAIIPKPIRRELKGYSSAPHSNAT